MLRRKVIIFCLTALLSVVFLSACAGFSENAKPVAKDIVPVNKKPKTTVEPGKESSEDAIAGIERTKKPEVVSEQTPAPASEPTLEPTPEPTLEPTPGPEVTTITISAVGDVTMGNYIGQDYAWSFREMYDKVEDKGYFFENVRDIFSADDFTIANLECVLTKTAEPAADRTYNMQGDPEYAHILTLGGVEAVSMGNNHKNDFGEAGVKDTRAALEAEGILYAYEKIVSVYETKGVRIGFVSVNESSMGKGVEKLMKDGIAKLQKDGVDIILACCHWGTEGDYYPEDYQRDFGKMCIDWGADLVIGHHPHVLQGVEEYKGKYIVHSLGNFCFGGNRNPVDKDTMIAQLTVSFVEGVRQEETVFRIIPCSLSSVKTRNDYRPTPATGDDAKKVISHVNEYSRDLGVEFDENGYPIQG